MCLHKLNHHLFLHRSGRISRTCKPGLYKMEYFLFYTMLLLNSYYMLYFDLVYQLIYRGAGRTYTAVLNSESLVVIFSIVTLLYRDGCPYYTLLYSIIQYCNIYILFFKNTSPSRAAGRSYWRRARPGRGVPLLQPARARRARALQRAPLRRRPLSGFTFWSADFVDLKRRSTRATWLHPH